MRNIKLGLYIREAILKNTARPTSGEEKKFTIPKVLRTSTSREGDSELGLILFCGIANELGMTIDEIVLSLSVDAAEARFKIQKFSEMVGDVRFDNKIKLIHNYLRLKYGISE